MTDLASKTPNRWVIAFVGTFLMVCLGTVYAWSFFQKPLCEAYSWTNTTVAWTFSLTIFVLGFAAAWGGMQLAKLGPRKLAVSGGVLFGAGYLIASYALSIKSVPLLYLGYGIVGGIGLGLGYVTPVATVAKWFPDKKGLATGMVVMGFGLGALVMSKIFAPMLMAYASGNLVTVFGMLGAIFLVLTIPLGLLLRNPPAGFVPKGYVVPQQASSSASADRSAGSCLRSRQFIQMWFILFCNVTAGLAIISFQSPLIQDIWSKVDPSLTKATLATYGATLIAVSSLFNGVGRFFWGGLSDRIGRSRTFTLIFATQIVAFLVLIYTGNPWVFALAICYVLLCLGGGFGTMPSFVSDAFGAKLMPAVYGAILTAWSAAGIAGPQIVALITDRYPPARFPGKAASYAFTAGVAFLAIGLALSLVTKDRRKATETAGAR